jgi:hypothetical protein
MEQKEEKYFDRFISKTVDFFFSKDPRKWLVLIVFIGFILRLLAVNNIEPLADEMVHGPHAIGIIGSGAINHQNQCPVWFYLTDIAYSLMGVNAFSARFLSFFFGLLTIPLLYLIAKKIFNEKIALISAFLLVISAFHIRYALIEMDEAMIFFILFAFYYFITGLEKKQRFTLPVFIFLAIAMLIKPITLLFIPGFAIYFFYFLLKEKNIQKRKELLNKNIKPLIIGSLLFLVLMSPVLVYNYLLYKEKGISDIIFARFFNIAPEIYSSLQGGAGGTFSISKFTRSLPIILNSFFKLDPAIFILGIFGIILIFLQRRRFSQFFVLMHLIPFIFLIGTQPLQTHFVPFIIPLCVSTSFLIVKICDKIKKIDSKKIIFFFLILIFLINIFLMFPYLTSKSAIFKARNFAVDNIDNEIVISDSRIYRGRTVFMYHDKHYIESSLFPQIIQQAQGTTPINIYFIECITDDCGWGTIKDQPDFNKSTEQMVNFFKNNSQKILTLNSGGSEQNERNSKPYFNIYKTTINANPVIFSLIDSTHQWFYYPVMWKGKRYDSYELDTFNKKILHNFAYMILWILIVIAIGSPIFLFREIRSN